MSASELLRSALHSRHVAIEAKMGQEAGWEMPLSYVGPLQEAAEARGRAGIFDVSHFGRIRVRGQGALGLLERACTAAVADQADDTTILTLLCDDRGGIIDFCRLIRLTDFWVLATSPVCRLKVLEHLTDLAKAENHRATVDDQTLKTTMLAVTGPEAAEILDKVLPFSVGDLAEWQAKFGSLMIARYIAERVSFLGQWGMQVSVPNMVAAQAWRFITQEAGENRISPAGLAAYDILRIEAGQARYGHELNQTVDPAAAGLLDAVDFGHDFLGAEAVRKEKDKAPARRLMGLLVRSPEGAPDSRAIPRQGCGVYRTDGQEAGAVTSGTFSPMLSRPIALAQIINDAAYTKAELLVEIDGQRFPAETVELPFVRSQ